MAKKTLLEKAKQIEGKAHSSISEEDIQLALAWARDEVSLTQCVGAWGKKNGGSIYSRLANALKIHITRKK